MSVKDNPRIRINFFNKISVRVTLLVVVILSIGIGSTIFYYLKSQNATIIESRESSIMEESNVLYISIKNNMLAGEAPIAVELFKEFSRVEEISEIMLFRPDGVTAFSDNKTLETVNKNLGKNLFKPKKEFAKRRINTDESFKESVKKIIDIFISDTKGENKKLLVYKPLINQPKCSSCHGLDHVIRGVIKISSPIDDVYKRTTFNMILSVIIYSIVVLVLSFSIILFLRRFVIMRVFRIGNVVNGVGKGDFKTKITIKRTDEIGILSKQINDMIDGLFERFKLSKFVSRSTLDYVKGEDDISLGGEKKVMTVLFSDIRGFTRFSEHRDPGDVMKILNEVMNLQGEIVHEFGGDIDKFVGDELMAVFEGEDMALRATKAAEKITKKMKTDFSGPENAVYVGIGINTGEMISGNMGTGERMDRTVIGDAVNLGARLCSAAGKNTIVLSEFSYRYVRDRIEVNEHEPIKVKGKEKPVKIFTLRRTL